MTTKDENKLAELVTNRKIDHSENQIQNIVLNYANKNCKTKKEVVSSRSLGRIYKKLDMKTGNADPVTASRKIACEDIRNSVSFIVMNAYMDALVPYGLKLNADATQFSVGGDPNLKVKVVYKSKTGPLKADPSEKPDNNLAYSIKYYMLMSAGGHLADPIFIIADPNMPEQQIDNYAVIGLGISTSPGAVGHVVFSKSRIPDEAFYRWFNLNILPAFVDELKKHFHYESESLAYLLIDGEIPQIRVYQEQTILDKMEANNIVVGKVPASTTAITQPCDRGNCFKAAKTALKHIRDEQVAGRIEILEALTQVYKTHLIKFKSGPKEKPMSALHQKKGKYGLLRICEAVQRSVKPYMVVESFRLTGVHPHDPERVFQGNYTKIEMDERSRIIEQVPYLIRQFAKGGELKDLDFDRASIRPAPPKDESALHSRRALIITSPSVVASANAKREAKLAEAQIVADLKKKKKEAAVVRKEQRIKKKEEKEAILALRSLQSGSSLP
jgi:hypothetical protein